MTFEELYKVIQDRKENLPENSSTTEMMTKGLSMILPKLNEEGFEVALALETQGKDEVALEVSQCFYYLLCLGVFLEQNFENIALEPDLGELGDNKHELAKLISREIASICHTPCLATINKLPSLLLKALEIGGSDRNHMFTFL
ncbi:MAG: phosphoribosyl-ATP diphosphatase [Planctomycetes bacterium]|nr:phosphoribosyl-ATP diphosphatase [Planctomycetota bacterium]